jgi:hypothetical protein
VRVVPRLPPPVAEGKTMSLEQLVHKVECGLYNLGMRLCSDEPAAAAPRADEAEGLAAELRRAYDALSRCRTAATAARRRIAANEVKAALLASRVETRVAAGDRADAWEQALELDRLRQELTTDRDELPYLETACRNRQRHVARVERRLAALRTR